MWQLEITSCIFQITCGCLFFGTMSLSSLRGLFRSFFFLLSISLVASWPTQQSRAAILPPWAADHGHNKLYRPTAQHIFPMKKPFIFDAKHYYYEPHKNNDKNGTYKRSSCPAVNTLANRGFIPRTGRTVTYQNLAQSMRDVFNFGDDNVLNNKFEPDDAY